MSKTILLLLFLSVFSVKTYSQDHPQIGKFEETVNENGIIKKRTVINAERNEGYQYPQEYNQIPFILDANGTNLRWNTGDATAISNHCEVSRNGNRTINSWDLNNKRISLYGNANSTPAWEYFVSTQTSQNNIAISDTGGVIATGSYHSILLFNSSSNTPFFNYDLTTLPDTGIAGPVDITSNGNFLIACASRSDSSTIFGFNSGSTTPVWSFKVVPTVSTGLIQGIRISANDSVVIVNTYGEFLVFRTYTGQLLDRGLINPLSTSGTQSRQGISGDGSIIATINYRGYVRVFQWNGSSYVFQWEHQEAPGSFYNWMYAVDITDNGDFIAVGTLNFITASSYDGKVKVFSSGSSTPIWTFSGAGDEISNVSFSKSGNILSASSYGPISNSTEDLFIFKTFAGNVPLYALNTPGSLYWTSTSGDGRTVVAGGKAIHARTFGNGGTLYNIEVDTNDIPVGIVNNSGNTPESYTLYQNYPNPFNPSTQIRFDIAKASGVKLTIYNQLGQQVTLLVNGELQAGSYSYNFDASAYPSGVYFYKLETEDFTQTKKMLLIK